MNKNLDKLIKQNFKNYNVYVENDDNHDHYLCVENDHHNVFLISVFADIFKVNLIKNNELIIKDFNDIESVFNYIRFELYE